MEKVIGGIKESVRISTGGKSQEEPVEFELSESDVLTQTSFQGYGESQKEQRSATASLEEEVPRPFGFTSTPWKERLYEQTSQNSTLGPSATTNFAAQATAIATALPNIAPRSTPPPIINPSSFEVKMPPVIERREPEKPKAPKKTTTEKPQAPKQTKSEKPKPKKRPRPVGKFTQTVSICSGMISSESEY